MTHSRNTSAMRDAPRCGARTKAGTPCALPAIRGRTRCRLHGGATRIGAPMGNRNALKQGTYIAKELAWRKRMRETLRTMKEMLERLK